MEYLKKILFNNKKIKLNIFSFKIKLTPDDCDPHMKHGVGKS